MSNQVISVAVAMCAGLALSGCVSSADESQDPPQAVGQSSEAQRGGGGGHHGGGGRGGHHGGGHHGGDHYGGGGHHGPLHRGHWGYGRGGVIVVGEPSSSASLRRTTAGSATSISSSNARTSTGAVPSARSWRTPRYALRMSGASSDRTDVCSALLVGPCLHDDNGSTDCRGLSHEAADGLHRRT